MKNWRGNNIHSSICSQDAEYKHKAIESSKKMADKLINIFSFFSGAGFLDLGFELEGQFDIVYVNEFHKDFDDIYTFVLCEH